MVHQVEEQVVQVQRLIILLVVALLVVVVLEGQINPTHVGMNRIWW